MKKDKWIQRILVILILAQCLLVVLFKTTDFLQRVDRQDGEQAEETVQEIADDPGQLYAQSAVLIDADSGRILYGKNESDILPMASTTKIMTCILTLENMKDGQIATVSDRAARQPKVHLGVQKEEKYYVKDLLYSLMLESHNDSAVMIAEAIGGSVEEFAEMMNEKAKLIGCNNTHFVTPNGLDDSDEGGVHATTSADLARIMRYCITQSPKKDEFLEITRTKSYSFHDVDGKRSFSCNNHNAFLGMMDGALSGKTGFTGDAGYCYVGALKRDERTFIVALLACGWPNNKGYKWKDTRKLMEYGIKNYEYQNVNEVMKETRIPVKGGADPENSYILNSKVSVGMKEEDIKDVESFQVLLKNGENIISEQKLLPSLDAPVKKGEIAGEYTYLLNGEEIKRYDIVTLESIEERDIHWCFRKILERVLL